ICLLCAGRTPSSPTPRRAPHHNPTILSFTPAPITPWIYPNPPSRRPNAVSQATYQSHRLRLGRVSEAARLYLITAVTQEREPVFSDLNNALILFKTCVWSGCSAVRRPGAMWGCRILSVGGCSRRPSRSGGWWGGGGLVVRGGSGGGYGSGVFTIGRCAGAMTSRRWPDMP